MRRFDVMQTNWPPPLIANRYRLLDPIGEGGFGVVFRAHDLKFQPPRLVALKLLHLNLKNDVQICADLRREAGILASFSHPNILRVLDFEVTPDLAYIVTELAAGGSLAHQLRPDATQPPVPFTPVQVAAYLEQICRGLDEIHTKGQVHRDIKPANILLDGTGRVLLADFGVALTLSNAASSRLVTTMVAWGTAEYAAPEVWDDKVGKASDIYALGVLAYQMLTGYTPYQGSAPAVMKQHLTGLVPPLSRAAPGLDYPPTLDGVIAQAMAVSPSERYKKAMDFYLAFQAALDTAARPVPSLLGSFWRAIATPPVSVSPNRSGQPPVSINKGKSLSPQEAARQRLAQQLDYLTELFEKAERWGEWDSAIEVGKLILNLDKANQAILERTAHAYRERALAFLKQREYRHAFGDLMAAIKLDPAAHAGGLKRLLIVTYDFAAACGAVFKALQPPPLDPALAPGRSSAKTIRDFNQAIEFEPNRSENYFERGKYYFDRRDYERAIGDFSRALELEPDSFLKTCYYRERGAAFERQGNRKAARQDYREADKYLRVATNF